MAQWISIFEETPIHNTTYYVKINGRKSLLPFDKFEKALVGADTFLWLDESEDEALRLKSIVDAKNIDEFVRLDYQTIAEKLLTPYNPRIHKSIVFGEFHKYYLRIIASLRKQISGEGVRTPIQVVKYEDDYFDEPKQARKPYAKRIKPQSTIDRLRLLIDNPFIDLKR